MPILTDEERIGTFIGKYRLDAMLGEGGMGVVYRATNQSTGRPVAIKLLRDQLVPDTTARKRFQREARAAASLRHPNVVDVLDLGTSDDGAAFLVLELLQGESLGQLLERHGRLTVEHTLALLMPIMDALVAAHEAGFAHRDLKPDNIVLDRGRDGNVTPKLLDFGLAKPMLAEKATQLTQTGSVFGTPGYMSPEQAQGVQGQDDVFDRWAVGVILFECLTGEMPFDAHTAALLMKKILSERAPKVRDVNPEIPVAVAKAVDRALEQRLSKRYASMAEFVEALDKAIEKSGIELPRIGTSGVFGLPEPGTPTSHAAAETVTDLRRVRRERSRLPLVLGAASVLIVTGIALALALSGSAPEVRSEPLEPRPETETVAQQTDSPDQVEAIEPIGEETPLDDALDPTAEDVEDVEAVQVVEVVEVVEVAPRTMRTQPRMVAVETMEAASTTMRGAPPIKGWGQ